MKSKKTTFQPLTKTNLYRSTHSFSGKVLAHFPIFVKYLLLVKKECAIANVNAREVSLEIGEKIVLLCHILKNEVNNQTIFAIDPFQGQGGLAINTNVNELIAEFASIQNISTSLVNKSQSANDICLTALNATLLDLLIPIKKNLQKTISLLNQKALEVEGKKEYAFINLQKAGKFSIETRFQGYRERLNNHLFELSRKEAHLCEVPLGYSTFGTGEGVSKRYRKSLKLSSIHPRLIPSFEPINTAQNADAFLFISQALESIIVSYLKLAKDIRLLQGSIYERDLELYEFPDILPDSFSHGIKKMPSIAETMIQACILASGKIRSVQLCYENAELDQNVYGIQAGLLLYELLEFFPKAMERFQPIILEF